MWPMFAPRRKALLALASLLFISLCACTGSRDYSRGEMKPYLVESPAAKPGDAQEIFVTAE